MWSRIFWLFFSPLRAWMSLAPVRRTALVAVILEDGVVEAGLNAGILGRRGEILVVLGQFVADRQTFFVLGQAGECLVVGQFLPPGLDGKIGLAVGDDRLGGIGVLDDQVTGIA